MDSALPVAAPPSYPSRRGWLIAFGIVEILMGCLFLLMILGSAIVFLGPAAAKMPPNAMPAGPFSRPVLMAFVGLQYGLLAAVFFTGGVGSIRCKNWARIMMLVVGGLWLGLGLFTTLIMAFVFPMVMRQQPQNVAPGLQHAIIVGMIVVMTFFMVLLPALFLFFYTRKSVKATCLAPKAAAQVTTPALEGTPTPGVPVPLAILGVWIGLGAFSVLGILFMRVALLFGIILHGAAAVLVLLAFAAVSAYSAWAIFHQRLMGWYVALLYTLFGVINMVVSYLRYPNILQLFQQMGYSDQTLQIYNQFPKLLPMTLVGSMVLMTVFFIFLLYTRKFFPNENS